MDADFGGLELPVPQAPGGGSLDLPLPAPPSGFRPESNPAEADLELDVPEGVGGVQFGEIDLGGPEEGMEFDGLPEERTSGGLDVDDELDEPELALEPGEQVGYVDRPQTVRRPAAEGAKRKRGGGRVLAFILGFGVLLGGAGVALGFTPYGYFGIFFVERFFPGAGDPTTVRAAIQEAEGEIAKDTYGEARQGLARLAGARTNAGLNREMLARSLLHENLFQLRYGSDSASATRASRILSRLEQRGFEAPRVGVARAADALRQGDLASAASFLAAADISDPWAKVVSGELALAEGDPSAAVTAFAAAEGLGPRATWGIARARLAAGEDAEAEAAIDATLEASPQHAGALVEKARRVWHDGDRQAALSLARRAAGVEGERSSVASRADRAAAWTLIGLIFEQTGNRGRAHQAFERALTIDDVRMGALLGAGRLLLSEGRYRDALARFQAVITSGLDAPPSFGRARSAQAEAKLGAARAMIELEMASEARAILLELQAQQSDDSDVVLYLGKVAEAAEDPAGAEQAYRDAIRIADDRFEGYLALAELFFSQGRPADASEVPDAGAGSGPRVVRNEAGTRAHGVARNELEAAVREFEAALGLDRTDMAARFGLGVALRRSAVSKRRSERLLAFHLRIPTGRAIALERGLLYEAQGRGDDAVSAYERALSERPGETDLVLRLGAAMVSAGRIDEAEAKLAEVMEERPNSAEAQHFMGRVLFARGDYRQAMSHLTGAVSLDPSRAEFHLYVAWAALEQGNLGRALEEVEDAIERDPSLGDAYWIRGQLRVRTGQSRDALTDLSRALELKPGRFEAHAAMGDAYEQQRNLRQAVGAYEQALETRTIAGVVGGTDSASSKWIQATAVVPRRRSRKRPRSGDETDPAPGWLAEAHRLRGEAHRLGGDRAQAIAHYRRYMEIAPDNAIDREDVVDRLARLGVTLDDAP